MFAHPVYLQRIRVKVVYEGHRVKVRITGATKSLILFPLSQCKTSIGNKSRDVCVQHGVFGYGGSNDVDASCFT